MKKIIQGVMFNTETAKEIANWGNSVPSEEWEDETLYRKKNGQFFLYGEGGAASRYAESMGTPKHPGPWQRGNDIIPITIDEAKQWAEKKINVDEYEEIFGKVPEDDDLKEITIQVNHDDWEKLHKIANSKNMPVDKLVQKAIVMHLPK